MDPMYLLQTAIARDFDISFVVQAGQFIVTLVVGGGVIFGMGRLAERVTIQREELAKHEKAVQQALGEIKDALFGGEGSDGIFVRRVELELMLEKANSEHAAFDRRLTEQAQTLGSLQERVSNRKRS